MEQVFVELRQRLQGRAIGLCVTALQGGGTEKHCELIARGFRQHEIRTVLFVEAAQALRAGALAEVCDRIVFDALAPSGKAEVETCDVALYHLNVWSSESTWVDWLRKIGKPYVATLHTTVPSAVIRSLFQFWRLGTLWNALTWKNRVRALACPVVAISALNQRRLEGLKPRLAVRLIWNGIPDEDSGAPLASTGPIVVAWVGSLNARKRPFLAVEVARRLGDDFRLVLAGTGPEAERLRATVADFGINNVEFLGHVASSTELLRRSRMLLVTSKWEGLPYVAAEAMALNRPVVATPCGALDDLIAETGAGLLCKEDAASLAAAIRMVASGQDEGKPVDTRPRQAYERLFRYDDFVLKLGQFYCDVLRNENGP